MTYNEIREWLLVISTIGATTAAVWVVCQNSKLIKLTNETVKTNFEMLKANQEMVNVNQDMVKATLPPLVDIWFNREGNKIFFRAVTNILDLKIMVWDYSFDTKKETIVARTSTLLNIRPASTPSTQIFKYVKSNTTIQKDLSENIKLSFRNFSALLNTFKTGNQQHDPENLELFLTIIVSYRDIKSKAMHNEYKILWLGTTIDGENFV